MTKKIVPNKVLDYICLMKLIEIDRYKKSNSIYSVTILGMRFDFRRWYQTWVNEGDNHFNEDSYSGWSDVWLSEQELYDELWYDLAEFEDVDPSGHSIFQNIKRDAPKNLKHRKVPLIYTICNWKRWWFKNKKLLIGFSIGFLLSLLILH